MRAVVQPEGVRLHFSAIVRVRTRAFVVSQSLRKVDFDKRHEIGVLINNPAVTRRLMQVFASDWALPLDTEGKGQKKEAVPT